MNNKCATCQTLSLAAAMAKADQYQRALARLYRHQATCEAFKTAQPERYQLTRALRQPCQAHQFTRGVCDTCGVCEETNQ